MEPPDIYLSYPENLEELNLDQELEIVKYLCQSYKMAELRERQDLIFAQEKIAFQKRDEKALKNLRVMERHCQCAILMKTEKEDKE